MRSLGAIFFAATLCAQTTAFTGATVVDGTGAAPRAATVLIRGDRIVAVGPSIAVPPDARVIDARGHTLLPGFFDLHTHLPYSGVTGITGDWPKVLKAYLHCGVTSVVDFGTYPETFEPMRRLVREGVIPGPRLHLAARISTPLGHGAEGGRGDFFTLEVQTPREARAAVQQWLTYQPDVIKVFTDGWRYGTEPDMTSMEEATLRAIVDEAHKRNVEVLTHTVTLERAKIAARAGVDVIAHGIGDADADPALIRLLREHGTTYVSTLAVFSAKPRGLWMPLMRTLLEPQSIAFYQRQTGAAVVDPARQARWQHLMHNTAVLRAAGVRIATGTDAGVTGTHHGLSTLREMELLVAGGLTPLEALTAGTGAAARALHVETERGLIAPGLLADLVLIQGAPHDNITDVERVRRVFLGGKEVDRAQLARDIATTAPTPLPAAKATALVDDFESANGRTRLDTLRVNATDDGSDHSRMLFQPVARPGGGRALAIQAQMAIKDRPYAQLILPLRRGGVEPVDATAFTGVRFEARGEGAYRLLVHTAGVRDWNAFAAGFAAGAEWKEVLVPFSALVRPRAASPATWTARDLLSLAFEISRAAGTSGWLEIDNVRFY